MRPPGPTFRRSRCATSRSARAKRPAGDASCSTAFRSGSCLAKRSASSANPVRASRPTSLAILRLLPRGLRVDAGDILLNGVDVLAMSPRELRAARGSAYSMVLQDPMSSLDPCFQIRSQMREALNNTASTTGRTTGEIDAICRDLLHRVRMPEPDVVLRKYPHELSGGMRQRVTSAIALSGSPDVLIADEPMTALDVTTQALYLSMLKQLQVNTGFSLVFISHDLLLVKHLCDRLIVMYAGQVVEEGPLSEVLTHPQHPYTRALLR